MNQLEVNSTIATIVEDAKTKLREIIFKAVRAIQEKTGASEAVVVKLEGEIEAKIDPAVASILHGGFAASEFSQLESIARGLAKRIEAEVAVVDTAVNTEVKSVLGAFFSKPSAPAEPPVA